jgi:type I restriction enzyme R subunit
VIGMALDVPGLTAYPEFPAPTELWSATGREPTEDDPRIYPPIAWPETRATLYKALAVARALDAIVGGERRVLLALAEGSGRIPVAVQIVWKLLGSRRCRRALVLVTQRERLDYAERMFRPFGDRVATLGREQPARDHREVHLAPIDLFFRKGEFSPPEAIAKDYDLIVVPDAEGRPDWTLVASHFDQASVVGMSDREPPSAEVVEVLGLPRFSHPLEAELAIRAAAEAPEDDLFDKLNP